MPESFNAQYALPYERHSATPTRTYEAAARAQLQVGGAIEDDQTVLEIGSGTGNSSIIFARSNPNLRRFICVEPSGFIYLAAHKLGKKGGVAPESEDSEYNISLDYIEEQRKKALSVASKIHLVRAKVPGLPFPSETFDRAYLNQVVHWLAFPNETSAADYKHLERGLTDIAQTLKPGGRVLFDSNGHIFNFGENQYKGRNLNDIHYVYHPLYRAFDENFFNYASKMGFSVEQDPQKPADRLRFIFNMDRLRRSFENAGLTVVPNPQGEEYTLTPIRFPASRIAASLKDTVKMHHFRHPGLIDLLDAERDRIIEEVLEQTVKNNPEAGSDDYYETLVTFMAVKTIQLSF